MYYTFSNAEELRKLLKEKRLNDLAEEFLKARILVLDSYKGIALSAGNLYKIICKEYQAQKQTLPQDVSEHAVTLFAEAWDIETIKEIDYSHGKYGFLNQRAKQVLEEYENYKTVAIMQLKSISSSGMFEKEITKTCDGIKVFIKYAAGRLSLFRNSMEYVIYYGDDFY